MGACVKSMTQDGAALAWSAGMHIQSEHARPSCARELRRLASGSVKAHYRMVASDGAEFQHGKWGVNCRSRYAGACRACWEGVSRRHRSMFAQRKRGLTAGVMRDRLGATGC